MKISEGNWMCLVSYPVSRSYLDRAPYLFLSWCLQKTVMTLMKQSRTYDHLRSDAVWLLAQPACSPGLRWLSLFSMPLQFHSEKAWFFFFFPSEIANKIDSGLLKPLFNDLNRIISRCTWNGNILKVKLKTLCRLYHKGGYSSLIYSYFKVQIQAIWTLFIHLCCSKLENIHFTSAPIFPISHIQNNDYQPVY